MRITARARLTALYGGLLLIAGGGLVASVYVLMRQTLADRLPVAITTALPAGVEVTRAGSVPEVCRGDAEVEPVRTSFSRAATTAAVDATNDQLLVISAVALTVFAVLSVFLAWWMAGRVLRPVHTITATARRLAVEDRSGDGLSERIALKAPPGELKDLADTFDAMLDRLESFVSAQRRFVANAAHELRTPLAVQRAALEIGLAAPDDPDKVTRVREKLLEVADRSERLIEGLLLLSTSDQGLERTESIDAAGIVEAVLAERRDAARDRDITVEPHIEPVRLHGDAVLFRHLVSNLLENALRYNEPGGRIVVRLDEERLEVANTGQPVPPEVVSHLFEPFRRLHARRHAAGEGAGLGLSIVASIARAHDCEATAEAAPGGGLTVRVTFPRSRDRVTP